mgnify:CR=1 FL=1
MFDKFVAIFGKEFGSFVRIRFRLFYDKKHSSFSSKLEAGITGFLADDAMFAFSYH